MPQIEIKEGVNRFDTDNRVKAMQAINGLQTKTLKQLHELLKVGKEEKIQKLLSHPMAKNMVK